MKRNPHRLLAPLGAVACTALLAVLLAACGGPTRSVAAVCKVWNTDAVALHDKYANAASQGGFQAFLDVVSAPNDLATLMDKLAAVAPTGIEPDFKALAHAFHEESSAEGDVATHPLGALASGVIAGLSVSGSEQRVDNYLQANCPGSLGVGSEAATSPTPTPVPTAPASQGSAPAKRTPPRPTTSSPAQQAVCLPESTDDDGNRTSELAVALTGTAANEGTQYPTATRLRAELATLATSPDRTVATLARTLGEQLRQESPAAHSSLEALARLRFAGDDPSSELKSLDQAYELDCGGVPAVGSDARSTLQAVTPAPTSSGGITIGDSVDGGCSSSSNSLVEVLEPLTLVFQCGATVEQVDGTTGALTTSTSFLPTGDTSASFAGSTVAWVTTATPSAQGLTAPTWSVTLHLRTLTGQVIGDPVVAPSRADVDGEAGSGTLAFADQKGIVVLVQDPEGGGTSAYFYALDGTLLATVPVDASANDFTSASFDTVSIAGDLYSMSGSPVWTDQGNVQLDPGCGANGLVSTNDDNSSSGADYDRLTDGTGGPKLSPLPPALLTQSDGNVDNDVIGIVPEGIVTFDDDNDVVLRRWDGSVAWTLSRQVVSRATVVGGWVVVQNQSGNAILVDPSTGQQATGVAAPVQSLLLSQSDQENPSQIIEVADPTTNEAVTLSNDVLNRYTFDQVCR